MKLTLNLEMADNHPDRDAIEKLITTLGETIGTIANINITYDKVGEVSLSHSSAGSGHVWAVWIGDTAVWTYASIEGPMPDALEVWNALAGSLPTHDDWVEL